MVNEALKGLADGGVKVTEMLHDAFGASVAPHVLVNAKNVGFSPGKVMLEMLRTAVPGLDRVTTCTPLVVPTAWLPTLMAEGVSTACGVPAPVPVPVNVMICLLGDAEVLMLNEEVKGPATVGVKVTLMGHEPCQGILMLQTNF